VAEHREKFVLRAIGRLGIATRFFGGAEQPCVFDRDGGVARERLLDR
jgi:hypothetical protein